MRRHFVTILTATAAWLSASAMSGCISGHPSESLTRAELVGQYNANAAAVPRLWARAKIELKLPGDKGAGLSWGSTSPLASPNGLLLLVKDPSAGRRQDFLLMGLAPGAMELFRLGSSASEGVYYLWYNYGDQGAAWWGRQEYAGAPGVEMPLDPGDLLSVLCVTEIPTDFSRLPAAVLRMDESIPAYVLSWVAPQPLSSEIIFRREVFFNWDGKAPRAYRVDLFDVRGRVVMTARLRDYKPVRTAADEVQGPVMPSDIEITWPARGGRMRIVLSEMSSLKVWNRRQFLFEHNLPAGVPLANVTQVDKDIPAEGGGK